MYRMIYRVMYLTILDLLLDYYTKKRHKIQIHETLISFMSVMSTPDFGVNTLTFKRNRTLLN